MTDLAHALAHTFRGRADYVALGTESGGFEPHYCPDGIDPAWLDERHLAGVQALGFYVLTTDSTCFCTCVDFDNKPSRPDPEWRAKAEAVYFELVGLGLCPLRNQPVGPTPCVAVPRRPTGVDSTGVRRRLAAEKLGTSFREIYPGRIDSRQGPGQPGPLPVGTRSVLWTWKTNGEQSTLEALSGIRA